MRKRQQNSATYPVLFFLVDSADHITGRTGAMPTITLSRNGGPFTQAAGSVTEVGNGWYVWAAHATDRNTLGELAVHVEAAGADPVDMTLEIVPWDPFDVNLGLDRLDAPVTSRASAADYTAARAAKLDFLDAPISSRSTLNAADVWTHATRTLTAAANLTSTGAPIPLTPAGLVSAETVAMGDGTIGAATFQTNAITAAALATDAVLEIQSGLGTLANQTTIITYVDALEGRLTAVRAANLDNLNAPISSLADLLEADRYIDTTVTPWALVLTRRGTGGPGVGVELLRQQLFTETGAPVTSITTFVGRVVG